MAEIGATPGFKLLLLMAGFVVMPSLILLGLGTSEWCETPLGRWFGAKEPENDWKYRAGDTDKDGLIDF